MVATDRLAHYAPHIALAALAALASLGCRATNLEHAPAAESRAIEDTLDALYRSFNFDAGGQADWELLRSLLVDGAVFVAPVRDDSTPRAVGTDEFIADFRAWISASPQREDGFHERIVATRIDVFGHVSHAYVTFEGFVPVDGPAKTRGLDSIQLIRTGAGWRVVSFTTQFASADEPIPARFE